MNSSRHLQSTFGNVRLLCSCLMLAGLALLATGCRQSDAPADTTGNAADDFLTLMNVGSSQYERGDTASAVSTFQQAVAQQPTSIDAQLNLANALLLADRSREVLAPTSQVIEMDPLNGAAHYLAGCAYLRMGEFEAALQALQQAKDIDRTVNQVSFQLGVAYAGLGNLEEAQWQWRETIEFDPGHPAAYYRLSQMLMREGETDEAQELLQQHQTVVAGQTIPSDPSFLERCVYTEMRVPFVLAQPAADGIPVAFVEVTSDWLPNAGNFSGPTAMVDFQRDGLPALFVMEDGRQFRLLEFTNNQFVAVGNAVTAGSGGGYRKVLVGDLDNDRYDDVVVLGTEQSHVLKLTADARLSDRTLLTGLTELRATDGALADLDFTSKLSLTVVNPDNDGIAFYRNLGNLRFQEDTAVMGLDTEAFPAEAITIADANKDDMPDVYVSGEDGVCAFVNQRGGPLTRTNTPPSVASSGSILFNDFNNDLRWDMVSRESGAIRISFGGLPDTVSVPVADSAGVLDLDYDNDGWLDLLVFGSGGAQLWRNLGEPGFASGITLGIPNVTQALAADFDNDCDTDLLLVTEAGALRFFRNDGGNANQMLKFKAVGNRSNSSGIGARFELTAGDWRTMRAVSQTPLEIGVGSREQVDSLMIQWSQMRMNVESIATEPCRVSTITEVMQAQLTSCPYVYRWNGTTFEFVSDFLSAAPVGLPATPGVIIAADPEELLWVGDQASFPERDGRYLLKLTEELSEVLYLDEVKLVAVDHPAETKMFSTSKLLPGKPWMPHEIVTVQSQKVLRQATGTDGEDVTFALQDVDDVRYAPNRFGDHLMGYAQPTQLTLDFGPLDHEKPLVLTLNGWLRFGGAMGNMAASQNPDIPFPFPTLEAEKADGEWMAVDVRVGAPAGRTKSIIVDLTGKLPEDTQRLRLSYAFDLYWDQIALFEKVSNEQTETHWLSAAETDLRYRGFSVTETNDVTHPTTPIHDQINPVPLAPRIPSGWVTRYGEVDPLVAEADNALALINGGDALTVAFDANALPPLKEGYKRDFFLWSVGWDKDTDYHTIAGDRIDPLPWHGMDDQQYGTEERPAFASDELMKRYNTRWSGPKVPVKSGLARSSE